MLRPLPPPKHHDGGPHGDNFRRLADPQHRAFGILIGKIPRVPGKQQKRQDGQGTGHGQIPLPLARIGKQRQRRHGHHQLERIVVKRAQKLRRQKGQKAGVVQGNDSGHQGEPFVAGKANITTLWGNEQAVFAQSLLLN